MSKRRTAILVGLLTFVGYFSGQYGLAHSARSPPLVPITPLEEQLIGKELLEYAYRGCLYQPDLCDAKNEGCVDDSLFGTCSEVYGRRQREQREQREPPAYQLTSDQLKYMRRLMKSLVKKGYTWYDYYTQCVVNEALISYSLLEEPDLKVCDEFHLSGHAIASRARADNKLLSPQDLLALDRYISSLDAMPVVQKKDQLVKVHKYFIEDPVDVARSRSDEEDDLLDYLGRLSPEDLNLLRTLMGSEDEMVWDQRSPFAPSARHGGDKSGAEQWLGTDDSAEDDARGVRRSDANILAKLLDGAMTPAELREDEVDRMLVYVASALKYMTRNAAVSSAEEGEKAGIPDQEPSTTGKPPTSPSEKRAGGGSCPPVEEGAMGVCVEECSEDEDCLEGSICCGNGCGHVCHVVATPATGDTEEKRGGGEEEGGVVEKKAPGGIGPALETIDDTELRADDQGGEKFEEQTTATPPSEAGRYSKVESNVVYVITDTGLNDTFASLLVTAIQSQANIPPQDITNTGFHGRELTFDVNSRTINASDLSAFIDSHKAEIKKATGGKLTVVSTGIGRQVQISVRKISTAVTDHSQTFVTLIVCGVVLGAVIAVVAIFLIRRHAQAKQKINILAKADDAKIDPVADYEDLCRQRQAAKTSEKPEPLHIASRIGSASEAQAKSPSSRGSASSWSEEPAANQMDISTGHIVLSYMEDHLANKDRLEREWCGLQAYDAEPSDTDEALVKANRNKNRYSDVLPYDHSRVQLNKVNNASSSDYINASSIADHDPRNPAYIATQGPTPSTAADFWQMVWEQGSVVVVCLTKLTEDGQVMSHRYWPGEGSEVYNIYEVHLVSEHIWCADYLVRSFYLKNLKTGESRTVTQFHFLTWPDLGVPASARALLDFRRKVNRSYKGRSCPIVVHCSDGSGRSGTYILIDMVLNRMAKGAKEIDIAATLEHIRDQRMVTVKTKEQFEFVLMAIAEEVQAILKAMPQ